MKNVFDLRKFLSENRTHPATVTETEVNERVGSEQDIIALIKDRAAETGFSEQEEAMEVMEFIGQEYEIDFEFGAGPSRQAEEVDEEELKESKFRESIKKLLES